MAMYGGPFQNTGMASPDLSTFQGMHAGFRGGGEGFDFGKLLKERWAMQKRMMKAQLDQMKWQQQMQAYQMKLAQYELSQRNKKGSPANWIKMSKGGESRGPHVIGSDYRTVWFDPDRGITYDPSTGAFNTAGAGGSASMAPFAEREGPSQAYLYNMLMNQGLGGDKEEGEAGPVSKGGGEAMADETPFQPGFSAVDPDVLGAGPLGSIAPGQGGIFASNMGQPIVSGLEGGQNFRPVATYTPQPGDADFMGPMVPPVLQPGGPAKKGGYVPKTGTYKLHKGEVVLNPKQTKAMFPGIGPGPKKKGYQEGNLSWYELLALIRGQSGAGVGQPGMGNPLLPAPLGPGGPGTTPGLPDFPRPLGPEPQGLLGPGSQLARRPMDYPGGVGAGGRGLGPGRTFTGTGPSSYPLVPRGAQTGLKSVGRGATEAAKGGQKIVPVVGEAGEQVAKKMGKKGRLGLILGAVAAAVGVGSAIGSGEGLIGGFAKRAVGAGMDYELGKVRVLFGDDVADTVGRWLAGEEPSEEDVNKALRRIGEGPVPPGALGGPVPAGMEGEAPDFGPRIEREEGQVPKLVAKGPPEGRAQKFERYTSDLQRKVERSEHFSEMARINAENLERQINKRPYADNQGLKKMMSARMQESQRHGKAAEEARKEYSAIRVQQQQLDTEMAKQYAENRQNQLEGAFDSIDAMWRTAIKNEDIGEERFVQHAMGVLLPYMDQLQEMGQFGSREETQAGVQQLLTQGFEDPTQYQWLKLMLQQAR